MKIEKLDLFPTRVFVIEDFLTSDEQNIFHNALDNINPTGGPDRNVGVFLRDNKIDFVTDQLEFFYKKTYQAVKDCYNIEVDIFESRYNHMQYGQSLLFHHHLNLVNWETSNLRSFCVLTGCYYTNAGEGFAKLRLNNPQLLSRFIGEIPAFNLEPKPNSLILFPSWAVHGTTTHGSDITRTCLVMEMTLK